MFRLTDRHIQEPLGHDAVLVILPCQQRDLKVFNLSIHQFVDLQMTELPS